MTPSSSGLTLGRLQGVDQARCQMCTSPMESPFPGMDAYLEHPGPGSMLIIGSLPPGLMT